MLKDDMICRLLQHLSMKKTHPGKKANTWEPYQKPGIQTFEDGIICMNDLTYGSEFPNSFLDIWFPDGDRNKKRPAIIYLHGGGFCMGDKSSGDPLSTENQNKDNNKHEEHSNMLLEMVKRGYILVNASYALAPQYRFPCQIVQADQIFSYLKENADQFGIDMNRLILSGSSAGANITEIYGACAAEPSYAEKISIHPCVTTENLKVLLMDEAALETDGFNRAMDAMYFGWIGGANMITTFIGLAALMFGIMPISVYFPLFLFDIMDYSEWKTGKRVEGVLAVFPHFANKVASGIAVSLAGFIMGAAGYDGTQAVQTQSAMNAINLSYNVLPTLLMLVMVFIIVVFYNIDKEMPAVKADLERRRNETEGK